VRLIAHSRLTYTAYWCILSIAERKQKGKSMLVYEYKLHGKKQQYAAIEEAIRTVQFI
jgi:hypothetical protein